MKSAIPFFRPFVQLYLIIILLISTIRPLSAQVIPIGQTFSSDTIVRPFSNGVPVYSLHLYGSVQLYSDSSLVRVVLVDSYGNHLLVYESYPLITDTNSFSIIAGCDETCFLNGVIPDSIRVEVVSAFCTIDSLKVDTNYVSNVSDLQAQAKWNSDSVKIVVMNRQIQEKHMYWRAGRSYLSGLTYQEKRNMFGARYILYGFDYFKGGIFERWPNRIVFSSPGINVDSFDWRLRHGAIDNASPYWSGRDDSTGWLSPLKNQDSCGTCWVFAPVGCVEAMYNLYYNVHDGSQPHHMDVNISEMDIWNCPNRINTFCTPGNAGNGGAPIAAMERMLIAKRCDESCFDYDANKYITGCNKCNNPDTLIQLTDTIRYRKYFNQLSNPNDKINALQKILVTRGPVSMTVDLPISQLDHAMVAIGWNTLKQGDLVYQGSGPEDPDIILDSYIPTDNWLVWLFKNSEGASSPYYRVSNFYDLILDQTYGPTEEMSLWIDNELYENMTCGDEDGDGYYWWGVQHHKDGTPFSPQDCNCPHSVKAELEDCNDNDITAGPYATEEYNPLNQPLYSCIPNNCETSDMSYVVNANGELWAVVEGDRYMDSTVIIPSGTTLTIKCQVFFTPDAKIIVQPGGTLILDGTADNPAKLSSGCGQFWKGIEIHGNPSLPQTSQNQGQVFINNGIIENAVCGIRTGNTDYSPDGGGQGEPSPVIPSGGIIHAKASIFRNNIIGVEFHPYRDGLNDNESYFKACIFETTDNLLEDARPMNLLKVSGINTLSLKGCTFRNINMNPVLIADRGKGIYLYNAMVTLDTLKNLDNVLVRLPCNFDSLQYGIYAMASSLGLASLDVHLSRFKDNGRGIYASGFTHINSIKVDSSEFYYLHELTEDSVYMMYLNNCTGFKVHQNLFYGTTNVNHDQYGVIVNNSGPDNNYIYDNLFEKLTYGLQGLNINRNSDAAIDGGVPVFIPTGLRFICNKFADVGCESDFLINENMDDPPTLPGIAYNQRNAANISNPTQEPASNVFTQGHGNLYDTEYDINISTSVGDILYTYHTQPSDADLKPDDVSNPDWVEYKEYSDFEYVDSVSCRDDFFPEGGRTDLRSALSQANYKIDSLVTLLRLLVDDGSTDTLKSLVDNSLPPQSYDVYQDLLSASPFLSDSVVKSAIIKEEVLPNAMIRDIMVANPQSAKSEELLTVLDERTDPMPDSLWVDILHGVDTVSAMERLVDELDGWIQRRDLYFNALTELFVKDTTNSFAEDSLVSLYLTNNRLLSKYLLAQYYMGRFDNSSALTVIQNIPSQFELTGRQTDTYAKMVDLLTLLPQLYNDTSGYILPDSLQFQILENIAMSDYDLPGAWARNILIGSGLMTYQEPLFCGSTLKSSRKDNYHWARSHSIESDFKVFPNPAIDYIIIEYKNICNDAEGLIRFLDLDGRIRKSQPLKKKENQQIIPVNDLASGAYIVQFVSNGSCKGSQKVVIIR